jgi:D-apiose dehydrogenase
MSEKLLRGALVGAGFVTEFHLIAWQKIPGVEIVAVMDPDLDKARQRAAVFEIDRAYCSFDEMMNEVSDLDFVDIAAPPEAHLELVSQAAGYKLHILCQKPFAPDLRQARQMIEICQEAGVLMSVNENWRWRPWYREVKAMLAHGVVGTPVYAAFFDHIDAWLTPDKSHVGHRFLEWPRVAMYDMGIHYVDIMRFLFGEPESVYARMLGLSPFLKGDDRALVVLAQSDFTGVIDISWTTHTGRKMEKRIKHVLEEFRVEGVRGTLELLPDPEKGDLIRITNASGVIEKQAYQGAPFEAYKNSYWATQVHFLECLREGRMPETHAGENIYTLAVTLAAYESAQTNRVVDVARFMEH